jgi:predicted GIY-YIG superfamily endonuclease
MITESRIEKCLATVRSICASSSIDQYLIGYTKESAASKGDKYRSRVGFHHLVLLADRMTQRDALTLEEALQTRAKRDRRSVLGKKYHHEKRSLAHAPSTGGVSLEETEAICAVYIAWWDKDYVI